MRARYDGLFPGPKGSGVPPLDSLTMYLDLTEGNFRGSPAVWIQWRSNPPLTRQAAPALDALLVDRASFRLLFRMAASGPGSWAGRYELVQAQPGRVVQVTVGEDGATEQHVLEGAGGYFDFATYQFLFPFLELREGLAFRLRGYDHLEKKEEILPVRVVGRTRVADAGGRQREVWRVDVMPAHQATLISFYVSAEPPYFYGWDYRLTRDGGTAIKLTLREWAPAALR